MSLQAFLERLHAIAPRVASSRAVLAGPAAAHAYIAAATGWVPGRPPSYLALAPRRIVVLEPTAEKDAGLAAAGLEPDPSAVAAVVRPSLDRFARQLSLGGTSVPVLSREAVLAELLGAGGLAIALAGMLLRVANDPPIDEDDVRELLKAARQPERFQPLLELLAVR